MNSQYPACYALMQAAERSLPCQMSQLLAPDKQGSHVTERASHVSGGRQRKTPPTSVGGSLIRKARSCLPQKEMLN